MSVEEFSVPTLDHVTSLRGELAYPDDAQGPLGTLLIVPGGWFMERDGFMGDTYTEADLMYRRIGQRVLRQGFVVARYDNRGVTGNEFTIGLTREGQNSQAETEHYLRRCIESHVRRTVTPESWREDVRLIYDFVVQHPRVAAEQVVVFAHSEGGIHVARLIGRKQINPKGALFAAVITESPVGILQWQEIDKYVDEVLRWDRDGDGLVSRDDVLWGYENGSIFPDVGITANELIPPATHWSRSTLATLFRRRYEARRAEALAADDASPYPAPAGPLEIVAASCRWWKQWFTDETPTIDLLCDYAGVVSFHFGEIDSQTPAEREIAFAKSCRHMLRREPTIVLHPARGHAFRTGEPQKGPMDIEAEDMIVEDLVAMLRV
jgi:dienelactone hydrolase